MNDPAPIEPASTPPVTIRRHRVAWEAGDLDFAEITARRALSLSPGLQRGCWYLNPRYTVSSPAPTAAFFRSVLDRRSSWLRTCRQILGTRGQKHLSRQAEREGRAGILLGLAPEVREGLGTRQPSDPIPLSGLPESHRREVLKAGTLAKRLAFAGVLFIDGEEVAPRAWKALADEVLERKAEVPVHVIRRKLDLADFKATGDPELLRAISRSDLQEHLDRRPTHVAYVDPRVTVSAPSASHAFYRQASTCQAEWCMLLKRTLGCGNFRRARRAADAATLSLVYDGTLIIGPRAYLPGFWPIHAPKPQRLKQTPFGSPTVPPEFLGLNP